MAWSSRNGNYWRAGVTLTKVSETDTSITLKYTALFSSDYRINVMSSITWSMSTSGAYSWSSSSGGEAENRYIESENDASVTLGTKQFTVNKTTSSQTVTAKNTVKVTSVSSGTQTATATYTIPAKTSYTVSYNANGGSGAPSSQTKWHGTTLTLSSTKPTKSGYTFVGWGTSTTDTSADYSAGGSYTANASITLYAIWSKTITLTYNANGGSGAPSSQSATVYNSTTSKAFTLSSTKPTRTGYTFLGWSTSNTATSASYSSGGSITLSSSDTLYAVWSENKLTVNYYSNYATYATYQGNAVSVSASTNVLVHSQDFYYDNSYSSALSNVQNQSYLYLARIGYTPTGYWGTTTSGGNLVDEDADYSTGQALAQALGKTLASGNASVNVYPQWKINTYKFNYNANGGIGTLSSQSINWNSTFNLSNNTFKREGYKFVGWNVYRHSDSKWYVVGQGWMTEDEILANGYEKKIYENQSELTFNNSWVNGDEYSISEYTMYAIWEISGVVYIDNGTSFEPYLAYIDDGTNWNLYLMYVDDGTSWNIIS